MIIASQGKTTLQHALYLLIQFCPLQNGCSFWYQAISKVKHHASIPFMGFMCFGVLTTICYIELCLLFEFDLGKLIHAGALNSRIMLSLNLLKKNKKILEPPSTNTLL